MSARDAASQDSLGLLGQTVADKYLVERVLGEGGSGLVYQATNVLLGEKVALKVVKPGEQDAEAFQKEAKLLFSFSHPNVVRLYDVGAFDSPRGRLHYLSLELLEGRTLASELAERYQNARSYRLDEVKRIIAAVLEALNAAHSRALIHRDIKPSNVMLCDDGVVKVLDFGTARGVYQQTQFATHFTPRYAAPEQWEPSRGAASPATDVFGAGLLLFELLTLRPALDGANLPSLMQSALSPQRPQLATYKPELAPVAQGLITKALALDPADRFRDAGEFLQALNSQLLAGRSRQLPQHGATTPLVDASGRPVSAAHTAYMPGAPPPPAAQAIQPAHPAQRPLTPGQPLAAASRLQLAPAPQLPGNPPAPAPTQAAADAGGPSTLTLVAASAFVLALAVVVYFVARGFG